MWILNGASRLRTCNHVEMLAIANRIGVSCEMTAWYSLSHCLCSFCAGYVNTNAYVLAPKAVLPTQKATAAGILAVTYQGAHVCGLLLGTVICYLVFTGF